MTGGPGRPPSKARPAVAVKTPRWCVERRGGLREEVVSERTWLRHSAHHPPLSFKGGKENEGDPGASNNTGGGALAV